MKAIAVFPGKPNSIHLTDLPEPGVEDVPDGRGVLVEVLRVGVDGTDKEINDAEYGAAPEGYDFLVMGHESFGRVLEVGPNVRDLAPGDYVVATVRRPGGSIYDLIGAYDMTTDETYYERGINLLHGFLTERYVDDPEYIVKVPDALAEIGVLLEPVSIVEKGIEQAYEIQRRLKVWRPARAAVVGAGSLGLLAALVLRLRGMEVTVLARTEPPTLGSELVEALGARYASTNELPLVEAAESYGPFDIVFEAAGASSVAFEGMEALGKNGVLVLTGISGGDKKIEVPGDRILTGLVLGNKVAVGTVNAHRGYFERGVQDMALAEMQYPGWLGRLLTHPVQGLDDYAEMMQLLTEEKSAIKVFVEVGNL
ncbi:MAG TPA: glucose 1-dehydrogenase [Rubrobacteraceae bacterium]|nr:glucose 1-dehydrogenase [Rubrobacteraceae bacterium]